MHWKEHKPSGFQVFWLLTCAGIRNGKHTVPCLSASDGTQEASFVFNAVTEYQGALGCHTLGSVTQDLRLKPDPIFLALIAFGRSGPCRSYRPTSLFGYSTPAMWQ
jgi:hypothetical protein